MAVDRIGDMFARFANGEQLTKDEIERVRLEFNKIQGVGDPPHILGATAWVMFNGTGTVSILVSENVVSVADHGVGDYTINFQGNGSASYAVIVTARHQNAVIYPYTGPRALTDVTNGAVRINVSDSAGGAYDSNIVSVVIFGVRKKE